MLTRDEPDSWKLKETDGKYSVRSGYLIMESNAPVTTTNTLPAASRAVLWNCCAPFKVQTMAWRALCNKLPTRDNLSLRIEVSTEGRLCPCCAEVDESAAHLLLHCKDVGIVWNKMLQWIGIRGVMPAGLNDYFISFANLARRKKDRTILGGLWICVVWITLKRRNLVIFENSEWRFPEMIEEIKRTMWSWLTAKGLIKTQSGFCDWDRDFGWVLLVPWLAFL
ncbi:hypothetical protein OROHE_001701 [Orobanche hederae]